MFNPRLTETLTDFPFARLNALIAPIAPPAHLSMINMSVGEPQGAMPAFARQIVNDEIDGWNRYPPNQGIPDLNVAIVDWLNRRYRLPAGLLDPTQHVIPTAGSKEGVYIIATVATPQQKARRQAGRGAAQSVLSGLSRRRGAVGRRAACWSTPTPRPASCPISTPSTRRRGSGCRWSISARPPIRRAPSPSIDYLQKLLRQVPRARRRAGGRRMLRRDLHPRAAARRARGGAGDGRRPAARIRSATSRSSIRCPSAPTPPACAPASWRAIRGWWR